MGLIEKKLIKIIFKILSIRNAQNFLIVINKITKLETIVIAD